MNDKIEVKIVGGTHDGEWVEVPQGAHSLRILKKPDVRNFQTCDGTPTFSEMAGAIEEFDLVPNEHFRGFAEAILKL